MNNLPCQNLFLKAKKCASRLPSSHTAIDNRESRAQCVDPFQDVTWALRQKVRDSEKPVGDQCFKCWDQWQRAFAHLTWPRLCESLKTDESVMSSWRQAQETKNGVTRTWPSTEVSENTRFVIEVEKSFKVLTDRELKKALGVQRLTKEMVKTIPCITVPTPSGTPETLWAFKDESSPWRRASVKMVVEDAQSVQQMSASNHLWEGQGDQMMKHVTEALSNKAAITELLEKDSLSSLESFLEKKQGPKAKDNAAASSSRPTQVAENDEVHGDQLDETEEDPDLEDAVALVGPAAGASIAALAAPASMAKAQPAKTKQPFSSAASVCGGDSERSTPPSKKAGTHTQSEAGEKLHRSQSTASLGGSEAVAPEGDGLVLSSCWEVLCVRQYCFAMNVLYVMLSVESVVCKMGGLLSKCTVLFGAMFPCFGAETALFRNILARTLVQRPMWLGGVVSWTIEAPTLLQAGGSE